MFNIRASYRYDWYMGGIETASDMVLFMSARSCYKYWQSDAELR